ncbi:MAG: fused MFS/spermidine synthase [Lachnospiraceae bacterium]|nr:fused MFS/spermidine synthase [Lachnospiraceae bacterium]
MAVELGASRLLAPYFSSSQIVWTIIISTIMIAMALGNIYGGRAADKNPDPDRLYVRLLIASVWIALIPVVGKYVILLITGVLIVTISSNLLIIAGFVACMVIFVFPCFLLGTVTPSLTKFAINDLNDSGSTVGRLGAANTIGSIIGTFLPTFVTIPAVGTAVTFLIFSGIILVLSLIYFISAGTCKVKSGIAVGIFVVCCIFGHTSNFAFWTSDLAYEGESIYNYLQVYEDEERVILSTNVLFGVQSVTIKDNSLTGMYYDYAMAAPVLAGYEDGEDADNSEKNMLILGNGTGTFARQCLNCFGEFDINAVEIDDKITDLAGEYFDMPESVKVTTYDGRAYLSADKGKYDVIMVDAYQDITVPFQMSSIEFFTLVRDHLKKGGVMVVNMNMRGNTKNSINDYLEDTICEVFDNVMTMDVSGSTNRELLASDDSISPKILASAAESISNDDLRSLMESAAASAVVCERGEHILTDDKSPVELLSMKAIDGIIKSEIGYYKGVFKREGITGLLEEF